MTDDRNMTGTQRDVSSVLEARYARRARPIGFYPLPAATTDPSSFARELAPYETALPRVGLVYLHVPYCEQRCGFCRFYSGPLRDGSTDRWVELVAKELAAWGKIRAADPAAAPIEAVFMGGGTPSVLSPRHIERVVSLIRDNFPMVGRPEITMEWYPKDADPERFAAARACGVNRISFGIQSWHADTIAGLGAHHSAEQADRVIEMAREAGCTNLNVDLMANVPGQTFDEHLSDVRRALSLDLNTISINPLELAASTPLAVKLGRTAFEEDDREKRAWLARARSELSSGGYVHQRARNFVRGSYVHRYNRACVGIAYDIIPIGPGAYGFYGGWPTVNAPLEADWAAHVEAHGISVVGTQAPEELEMQRAFVVSSLLELEIDANQFRAQFDRELGAAFPVLPEFLDLGVFERIGGTFRLSEPAVLYADDVSTEFYSSLQRNLFDRQLLVRKTERSSQYFPVGPTVG